MRKTARHFEPSTQQTISPAPPEADVAPRMPLIRLKPHKARVVIEDGAEIENYQAQMTVAQAKQYLVGKWWSTNEFGDFTDHCIELYDSDKYKSYLKGNEDRPIVGTYKLDFNKNEIAFSSGSSFQSNLDLAKRGNDYIIKKRMKDFELRFTKISIETSPEPELKDPGQKRPAGGGDENKAQ